MAKIRIRERDKTTSGKINGNNVTVFLADDKATGIVKVTTVTEAANYTNKDVIENIIRLGGNVLVGADYETAKGYLTDRNQYDVTFLLCDETDLENALEIATTRRDCAVVCTSSGAAWDEKAVELFNAKIAKDASAEFLDGESGTKGKYCLGYYGKDCTIDAGVGYIYAFLESLNNGNAPWLATAGAKRGVIPADLTVGDLKESEIDDMQSTVGKNPINPIANVSPWGVRIWGDRTAAAIPADGPVASNFATVRIAMCWLKKRLYLAAKTYQFEQDNDVLWVNFTSQVNTLLEEMVQSSGIGGYRWIRETADGRGKLKATLHIVPVYPVDDFDLTIELNDSLTVSE